MLDALGSTLVGRPTRPSPLPTTRPRLTAPVNPTTPPNQTYPPGAKSRLTWTRRPTRNAPHGPMRGPAGLARRAAGEGETGSRGPHSRSRLHPRHYASSRRPASVRTHTLPPHLGPNSRRRLGASKLAGLAQEGDSPRRRSTPGPPSSPPAAPGQPVRLGADPGVGCCARSESDRRASCRAA